VDERRSVNVPFGPLFSRRGLSKVSPLAQDLESQIAQIELDICSVRQLKACSSEGNPNLSSRIECYTGLDCAVY
jgi:hypothetical protein